MIFESIRGYTLEAETDLDGNFLKLTDDKGRIRWIPNSWVGLILVKKEDLELDI